MDLSHESLIQKCTYLSAYCVCVILKPIKKQSSNRVYMPPNPNPEKRRRVEEHTGSLSRFAVANENPDFNEEDMSTTQPVHSMASN